MTPRLAAPVRGRGVTLLRKVFDGALPGCINLGIGQPTDPIPESVRAAAIRVLESGRAPYGPTAGLTELRAAIGAKVYGGAPAEQILVTTGSQEALFITLMGLIERGEDVLVPEPGYPAYRAVSEMIGARPVTVPLRYERRFRLEPEAVAAAWTPNTRALVIGTPSNPTGLLAARSGELARLYAMCEEGDAWLIADEVYHQLAYREQQKPLYTLGERVITLSGISKMFACMGFRIGWVHAPAEIIDGLMPLHQQVALCAPMVGQHLALACLELWGEPYFDQLRARYEVRRAAAIDALIAIPGVRFHEPEGAFYVFVDVSRYTRETFALALRLRDEAMVVTAPGEAFGASTAGYLRISFVTEPAEVREGIGRIAESLKKWYGAPRDEGAA